MDKTPLKVPLTIVSIKRHKQGWCCCDSREIDNSSISTASNISICHCCSYCTHHEQQLKQHGQAQRSLHRWVGKKSVVLGVRTGRMGGNSLPTAADLTIAFFCSNHNQI